MSRLNVVIVFGLALTLAAVAAAQTPPVIPYKVIRTVPHTSTYTSGLAFERGSKGADVLFDGTKKSIDDHWEMWPKKDMKITWSLVKSPGVDGKVLMTNGGKRWGTHDLVTKKKYQDFEGHVEFVLMGKRGDDKVEGYSNSGVYLQNRYEIQIESPKGKNVADPYNWKIGPHGIGAFCMERVPDVNAWRPNGEWHSFHFIFKAARWDGGAVSGRNRCQRTDR